MIWLVANGKGIEKHNASTPDVDSCGDPPPEMESDDDGGDSDDPDRVRYPPPPSRTEYADINCILESAAKAWEGVGVNRPTKSLAYAPTHNYNCNLQCTMFRF